MKGILLFVLGVVISLIVVLLLKVGYFNPVVIAEVTEPARKIVVKHHLGAYHKIMPVIEDVEKWARTNGESCRFSLGEYIDDPKAIEEDRLNSNGGCVVEKDWSTGLPEGFTFREIPEGTYFRATFDGAPSVGPLKVYPKVLEEIEARGMKITGPIIEIYEVLPEQKVKTTYLFPVGK